MRSSFAILALSLSTIMFQFGHPRIFYVLSVFLVLIFSKISFRKRDLTWPFVFALFATFLFFAHDAKVVYALIILANGLVLSLFAKDFGTFGNINSKIANAFHVIVDL